MNAEQFQQLLEAQERRHQESLTALINSLKPCMGNNGVAGGGLVSSNLGQEQLVSSLSDRILDFRYLPEEDLTFEHWHNRYDPIISKDGASLPEDVKVRLLVSKLREGEFRRFEDAVKPKNPYEQNYAETVAVLSKLFAPTKSKFMRRYEVFTNKQGNGQTYLDFATKVNGFCELASPPISANDLKCLTFISGLNSDSYEIRLRCLQVMEKAEAQGRDVSLDDLIQECKRHTSVHESVRVLDRSSDPSFSVQSVDHSSRKTFKNPGMKSNFENKVSIGNCFGCGEKHVRKECPYRDMVCIRCDRVGHLPPLCRQDVGASSKNSNNFKNFNNSNSKNSKFHSKNSNSNYNTNFITASTDDSENCVLISANSVINGEEEEPYFVPLKINDFQDKFFVDTGSRVTLLTETTWRKIGSPALEKVDFKGKSFSNTKFELLGKCHVWVKLEDEPAKQLECCIASNDYFDVIGRPWIRQLNFLDRLSSVCGVSETKRDPPSPTSKSGNKNKSSKKVQVLNNSSSKQGQNKGQNNPNSNSSYNFISKNSIPTLNNLNSKIPIKSQNGKHLFQVNDPVYFSTRNSVGQEHWRPARIVKKIGWAMFHLKDDYGRWQIRRINELRPRTITPFDFFDYRPNTSPIPLRADVPDQFQNETPHQMCVPKTIPETRRYPVRERRRVNRLSPNPHKKTYEKCNFIHWL